MRVQWHRIREDAAEGFRVFREEIQAIFQKTLASGERAKARRALYQVEGELQERYQQVGHKIYRCFVAAETQLREKDFELDFAEIERLRTERQRILEELSAGEDR
jgi:hypothetical protein